MLDIGMCTFSSVYICCDGACFSDKAFSGMECGQFLVFLAMSLFEASSLLRLTGDFHTSTAKEYL